MSSSSHAKVTRILASIAPAAAGAAVCAVVLAMFLAFTSSTSAAGGGSPLSATLRAPGSHADVGTLSTDGIFPGETIEHVFTLSNTGSVTWASATMTTSAANSSLLDTDRNHGLQMQVDRCSTAWIETGTSPRVTYTCPGTRTLVLAAGPVIREHATLGSLHAVSPGASDHLRVALTLPISADNSFQGLSSTIDLSIVGVQHGATT